MTKGYMKGLQQPDNEADNLPITGEIPGAEKGAKGSSV